jgi:hypothetical protein
MNQSNNLDDYSCFNIESIGFAGCYSLYRKNQLILNIINWSELFVLLICTGIFVVWLVRIYGSRNKILLGKIINTTGQVEQRIQYWKNTREFDIKYPDNCIFILGFKPIQLNEFFPQLKKITVCDFKILYKFCYKYMIMQMIDSSRQASRDYTTKYTNDNLESVVFCVDNSLIFNPVQECWSNINSTIPCNSTNYHPYYKKVHNNYNMHCYVFTKLKNFTMQIVSPDLDSTEYYNRVYGSYNYLTYTLLTQCPQLKSLKIIDNSKLLLSQQQHDQVQQLKQNLSNECKKKNILLDIA